MSYYKLINGNNFVGVVTQHDFRKYQHKHKILLTCDEDTAQYVQYHGTIYRSFWMVPVTTDEISYQTIDIVRIDEDEYNILSDALDNGEEIEIAGSAEEVPNEETVVDEIETITIDYVKSRKVAEINRECESIITNGFNVQLSDGEIYHFSLSTQDQLNLATLSTLVLNGESLIPYHADGELCKFYSSEDITRIIDAAMTFKTWHVTYCNALHNYIMAMTDIESVSAIVYGTAIPEEYQSDVLKMLIVQQDNGE